MRSCGIVLRVITCQLYPSPLHQSLATTDEIYHSEPPPILYAGAVTENFHWDIRLMIFTGISVCPISNHQPSVLYRDI